MDKKKLEKIEEKEWIETVTRSVSPCGVIYQLRGEINFLKEKIGAGFKNKIHFPSQGDYAFIFGKKDWQKFRKAVKDKIEADLSWLDSYSDEIYTYGKEFSEFCKSIYNSDLDSKDNKELCDLLEKFGEYRYKLPYALYPPLIIEKVLEEKTRRELEKELESRNKEEEFERYWRIISKKTKRNETDEQELELLKLATEFSNKGKKFDQRLKEKLKKHSMKYGWIPYYGFNYPSWDISDFKEKIKNTEEPGEELKERGREKERKEKELNEILQEFGNTRLRDLIELTQQFMHLRPYRTEVLRKIRYYITPLYKEIANRLELDYEEVLVLTPEEIKEVSLGKEEISGKELKKRIDYLALVILGGEIEIVSEKEEIELLGELLPSRRGTKAQKSKELEGNPAYEGKAEGEVKIIESIEDSDKFEEGNVLVSSMTTPEMTSLVKKASAIVTDEGGLTCHAAVVSRELEVPCVIGTKKATKVLQDGDKVKVDAEEGIVGKIKSN